MKAKSRDLPVVDIVIPVLNEEKILVQSVEVILESLAEVENFIAIVSIVDNGSTDRTPYCGRWLEDEYPSVKYCRIEERGRGNALKWSWSKSTADYVSYMDVDLSTDLSHFVGIVQPLLNGEADITIGSRLSRYSQVDRSLFRETLSRGYNALLRRVLGVTFGDAQCGFKAMSKKTADELIPMVRDGNWFFDTELLSIAEWRGYRIREIPVKWKEDPDSRVKIVPTVIEDISGLLRLRKSRNFHTS